MSSSVVQSTPCALRYAPLCASAITQPCLPSHSLSSTESARASQLLPKCSGSLSPLASAASSSALLLTAFRSATKKRSFAARRDGRQGVRVAVPCVHARNFQIVEIGQRHGRILRNDW